MNTNHAPTPHKNPAPRKSRRFTAQIAVETTLSKSALYERLKQAFKDIPEGHSLRYSRIVVLDLPEIAAESNGL